MDVEKIINLYLEGMSAYKISESENVRIGKIYYHLSKRGVTRSNKENSRRYFVNHNYFSKIETEQQAYWLGYMFADGYVSSSNGKKIGVTSKDIEHMTKFRDDLESTYPVNVYEAHTAYGDSLYGRLLISSDKMYDDLVFLGCVEHKSKILLPPQIDKELERHFLRGLYDGDGSIKKHKLSKSGYLLSLVSTKEIIDWTYERIGGSIRHDKNKNIWYLDTSITPERLDYLYDDATRCLQRKFSRVLDARSRL
jgi:DNA-binding transcriptional regulator WhiA